MIALIRKFWADETAATAIEYGFDRRWYFACNHRRRQRHRLQAERQIFVDQQFAEIVRCRVGQAAMLGVAMTVMIQRVGLLDLTSMTERTNPVTGDPSTVTVVFWPRC
jgi:hypothetical protein